MIKYLPYGQLIEVRNDTHNLIGAILHKTESMTWPVEENGSLYPRCNEI
jgi:hypothetical protein